MTRGTLALAAGFVIAALFALYVLLATDSDPVATPARSEPPDRDQKIAEPAAGKPRLPPARVQQPDGDAPETIGAPHVRDHRGGAHSQSELPPAAPPAPAVRTPPDGRQINSQVTMSLSQKLRPALKECAANLAPDAAGKQSRIEGEITVSIKDHQATITAANFQLRDIAEAAKPGIQQCLVQRAVGFTASAGDESDVDGYPITLSLRFP
jgi:hypothetical protein